MILIRNEQNISIDEKELKSNAKKILELLGYKDFDLGILLTTNEVIHEYNKEYRDKDKPTDILSFPFYPDLKPGERIKAQAKEDKNLGDIIISPEYVLEDLPRWEQNFEDRMKILLVHGICHLLGYDHILDEDYEVMKKQEEWLLDELKK